MHDQTVTRRRRRCFLLVLAGALSLLGVLVPSSGQAAGMITWTGTDTKDVDGDTVWVDIAGDGRGPVQVRNSGIQTMEYGECHAAAASARMAALTTGKDVRLSSSSASYQVLNRPLRFVDVLTGSGTVDPQLAQLREGHALWINMAGESQRGHEYHLAMEQAAAAGHNLWDRTGCGVGPQSSITPSMWVKYDADLVDTEATGKATEFVRIHNPSSARLDLTGWWLRDASHYPRYYFPSRTTVAPHSTISVYNSSGTDTAISLYWPRTRGFPNPASQADDVGASMYLVDPLSNIRSHISYPCVYRCTKPALTITKVVDDAPGSDYENLNGEVVSIQVVGTKPVDLSRVEVTLGGHVFTMGPDQSLRPGETIHMHSGKGRNSRLEKYWNYDHPLLAPAGTIRLRTTETVPIACRARGGTSC